MTIKKKSEKKPGKIEIDLTGPEGNAFCLMGRAKGFCKLIGEDEKGILEDMRSGDYEHLVEVFEREFGDFVILYR